MTADTAAVVTAATALTISLWQWVEARHVARLRLLLGEKETVAHAAMSMSRSRLRWVRRSTIRALMAAALFEKSDRANLMLYRAIDRLRVRHESVACQVLAEFNEARREYGDSVKPASFDSHMEALIGAVSWLREKR